MTQLKLYIDDEPMMSAEEQTSARGVWQDLSNKYNGLGSHDAGILTSKLHRFQIDDSKPLEPQINAMQQIHSQLAVLGQPISDSGFAIAISEALPPSYEVFKTLTVATIDDSSQLNTSTLLRQIYHEEKCKDHSSGIAAMVAKTPKPDRNNSPKPSGQKPNTPKSNVRCTNPKCGRLGHTCERCWGEGEGGGSEGKGPKRTKAK